MDIEGTEFTENLIAIRYLYTTQKQFIKYTSEHTVYKKKFQALMFIISTGKNTIVP